jgi:hypothetical protein
MTQSLIDTYIYLAKRDKKGIKILTIFLSQRHIPERVKNFTDIPLDANIYQKIEQIAYDNRLNWELWIESAATYGELKTKLQKRGYLGLPLSSQPEIYAETKVINTLVNKKVMVQRPN